MLVIALVVAGVAVFLWLTNTERELSLRQSAVGFDALAIWLRHGGQPARVVSGWERIDPADVWLRILPLYDVDPKAEQRVPADDAALLRRETEVDIDLDVLREKIELLPTLVVLPKWRSGMRLTGIAHPDLLNDTSGLETLLGELIERPGELVSATEAFGTFATSFDGGPRDATLYLPRVLKGSSCEPLIGTGGAMVLGACDLKPPGDGRNGYGYFYLLTDPDLMDAHGLRLGANAELATAAVDFLSEGGLAVIDYTTWVWADRQSPQSERSWADLLRFFGYPFGILWAGLAATAAVILWRASVRYGAPIRHARPRASKDVSIDATARLLRLSGHDEELVSALVRQRLDFAAAEVFGPHSRADTDPLARLLGWLGPRNPALADALARSAEARPGGDPLQRLDAFETTLAKVLNDFGRTPRHG